MKTLGIIGGLGPMATAYLLELVISMTDAKTDQEHLDVIVFNRPNVPDRTAYILDHSKPSPLVSMKKTAETLESLGAGVICSPCVTSHYFYSELSGCVSVPFLNMVENTVFELKSAGKKKAGIMATTGTVSTGLFQKALERAGIEAAVPSAEGQSMVMSLIYDDIKAGKEADMEKFKKVERELAASGCDSIILGCTELSLIKKSKSIGGGYIDALEALAKNAVLACGALLKENYVNLIE